MDSSFLEIDLMRLDREWLGQPKLYFTYAEKLANAKRELENAKTALDVVRSEVDRDMRSAPTRFGLSEKPTESSINAKIPLQRKYREAQEEMAVAKHRVDILQAAVTALDHRKTALSNLVELHGQNYFAAPTAKSGASQEARADRLQRAAARSATKED